VNLPARRITSAQCFRRIFTSRCRQNGRDISFREVLEGWRCSTLSPPILPLFLPLFPSALVGPFLHLLCFLTSTLITAILEQAICETEMGLGRKTKDHTHTREKIRKKQHIDK
jgi:hypothetical protein